MQTILRDILQGLICIVEIAGIVGGVLAFSRGKRLLGLMAVAGFLLLGLNLLVTVGLEAFRPYAISHFYNIGWVSPCLATPLAFLGILCLVIAFFSSAAVKSGNPDRTNNE